MAKGKKISTDVDASVKTSTNGSKKNGKKENTSTKPKGVWSDDTAKAVAAVIAFLLIPTAIVAWFFASSQDDNLNSKDVTIEINKNEFTINPKKTLVLTEEKIEDETSLPQFQEETSETVSQVEQNTNETEEVQPESEDTVQEQGSVDVGGSSNKVKVFLLTLVDKIKSGFSDFNRTSDENPEDPSQDQASVDDNVEDESTETSQDSSNDQAVDSTTDQNVEESVQDDQSVQAEEKMDLEVKTDLSMLDTIKKLPDTSGDQDYVVQEGDSVYSISVKVCGNQSYYLNNLKRDYLKVGSTIKVVCE